MGIGEGNTKQLIFKKSTCNVTEKYEIARMTYVVKERDISVSYCFMW
jgi:hypothetical protein